MTPTKTITLRPETLNGVLWWRLEYGTQASPDDETPIIVSRVEHFFHFAEAFDAAEAYFNEDAEGGA